MNLPSGLELLRFGRDFDQSLRHVRLPRGEETGQILGTAPAIGGFAELMTPEMASSVEGTYVLGSTSHSSDERYKK